MTNFLTVSKIYKDIGWKALNSSWPGIDDNGFNFRVTLTISGWTHVVDENVRRQAYVFSIKKTSKIVSMEYLKANDFISSHF